MFWELPVELSQRVGLSTAGWWGSQHTLCSQNERECVFWHNCFGLSCQTCVNARVIFIIYHRLSFAGLQENWSLSQHHLDSTGCHISKTDCPTCKQSVDRRHKRRATNTKGITAHLNLLQTLPKCSSSDVFASSRQEKTCSWWLQRENSFLRFHSLQSHLHGASTHPCLSTPFHPKSYQFC